MARLNLALRSMVVLMTVAGLASIAAHEALGAVVLVPGVDATNVTSTGFDSTTGPARASIAPVFPGMTLVPNAQIGVVGTSDLNANYAVGFLNDGTGYNFLSDSVTSSGVPGTNRGWIPSTTGAETATFTFASPLRLSGVDFLTLFTSRTAGTFAFDYSLNNGSTWLDLATVTNDNSGDVFRLGFSFDPIDGVTNARLVTTGTASQLFIGEVDFFVSPPPLVPEPSTSALLAVGLTALGLVRRRASRATGR